MKIYINLSSVFSIFVYFVYICRFSWTCFCICILRCKIRNFGYYGWRGKLILVLFRWIWTWIFTCESTLINQHLQPRRPTWRWTCRWWKIRPIWHPEHLLIWTVKIITLVHKLSFLYRLLALIKNTFVFLYEIFIWLFPRWKFFFIYFSDSWAVACFFGKLNLFWLRKICLSHFLRVNLWYDSARTG